MSDRPPFWQHGLTADFYPHFLIAAVILVLGLVLGAIAARVVALTLAGAGFNRLGEQTGLVDDFARIGITMAPSRVVGRIVLWVVLVAAFVQAVNGLELRPISASLNAFLIYLPHVVLAVILVLAGVIVGDTVGRGTARAMSRSGVLYHDVVGGVLRTAIILIAILMALEQLTIASVFLFSVLLILIATGALAVAIAGGWGGRAFAENLIAARYVERHLALGDHVRVEGQTGIIERFDAMSTIMKTDDGRRIIYPNGLLANSVVEVGNVPLPPIPND